MTHLKPNHYWLYKCGASPEDSNLASIYSQGWRAVAMTAAADGETIFILLEKGADPRKKP